MTFQPAEHTALVEVLWSGPGQLRWQNNLHFTKNGFDESDQDTLNEAVESAFILADMRDNISSDVLLGSLVCTDLREQGAPQKTRIVGLSGNSVEDMAAQGASLVATFRTDTRGRSFRGRFYMAGIGDVQLSDGEYLLATAQDLVAFLESIQEIAAIVGWTLVVLSRQLNDVIRPIALGTAVVEILVRSLLPGSQRRRNRRP